MRGSRIVGTLFIIKPQIGSKFFLKSTFLANSNEILIFESQNTIVRSFLTRLFSYLSKMVTIFHAIFKQDGLIFIRQNRRSIQNLDEKQKGISDRLNFNRHFFDLSFTIENYPRKHFRILVNEIQNKFHLIVVRPTLTPQRFSSSSDKT